MPSWYLSLIELRLQVPPVETWPRTFASATEATFQSPRCFHWKRRWCFGRQNTEKSSMPTNPGEKKQKTKNGKRCGKTHCIMIRLQLWPASVAFSGKNTRQTSENNWEGSLPMNQVLDYWKASISSALSFEQCDLLTWNTPYFACCQLTVPDMI